MTSPSEIGERFGKLETRMDFMEKARGEDRASLDETRDGVRQLLALHQYEVGPLTERVETNDQRLGDLGPRTQSLETTVRRIEDAAKEGAKQGSEMNKVWIGAIVAVLIAFFQFVLPAIIASFTGGGS